MAFALQKRCSTTELSRQSKSLETNRNRVYRSPSAQSSSWVRLWQPVLASRLDIWLSTVRRLRIKAAAIALLLKPRSSCWSTRRSAADSSECSKAVEQVMALGRLPLRVPTPAQELSSLSRVGSEKGAGGGSLARRIGRLATRAVTRSSVSRVTSPSSKSIST